MVTHSPTHRLHEALDSAVAKVARINQDAAKHAAAHRAESTAADQDRVTNLVTGKGGR